MRNEWSTIPPFLHSQVESGACGQGIKRREVWCQREDGQRVDFQFCSRQTNEEKRQLENAENHENNNNNHIDGLANDGGSMSPFAAVASSAGDTLGTHGGVIRKHKQIIEGPLQTEATCHVPCPEVSAQDMLIMTVSFLLFLYEKHKWLKSRGTCKWGSRKRCHDFSLFPLVLAGLSSLIVV